MTKHALKFLIIISEQVLIIMSWETWQKEHCLSFQKVKLHLKKLQNTMEVGNAFGHCFIKQKLCTDNIIISCL